MKKKATIFLNCFLVLVIGAGLVQNALSQNSNYHNGNKLRITFSGDGTVEGGEDLTAEWPIGTGQEYLNFASPLVAVESGAFSLLRDLFEGVLSALALKPPQYSGHEGRGFP